MFHCLRPLVAAGLCVAFVEAAEAAGRGADLAREMQQTGKPALIIAGNEGCVYCRQMAEELATDRSIQRLAQQYLILKINTESADWPRLRETFKFEEGGIPAVFVVRADGELLYSDSGKPRDMSDFLERNLESAGTILESDKLRAMQRAVRLADRNLKRGNYALVWPIVQEHAGSGSYAQAAQAIDAIQAAFISRVTDEAAAAEDDITGREDVLEAALSLAELRRVLAEYEPTAEIVETVWSRIAESETQAVLLDQAATLDNAALRAKEREWSEAAELYESVIAAGNNTPAGEYASEQLAEVRARESVAASGADERPSATSSPSGEVDERAAASHLRFARLYLERDAKKARDYLQRAINAAPESDAADEARKLLEQLGERD